MIALLFAAVLMSEAPPADRAALKAPQPIAATHEASSGPILTSVAVTLECTARASGRVEACTVLGETHPGLGFAEAAIVLMRDAEVEPGPRDVQFARTIQFVP